MAFLTDRTLATGVTFTDLIHIVNPNDISQNPAGSSYKATIGQVTNLVNSVVITGGTYDSSTGVITFTNSSGGTFTVSGFVSGFTDTYVSGGTYTAGTATFTNTTGGTFTVTGFTEPFSGGSGNCITDFYVTNIYGCSPITFKSESKFDGNTATGLLSFAHGQVTTASGDYSHSEGRASTSSGTWSHSEGRGNTSSGNYSHSEGQNTTSSGLYSHSEGNSTTSSGIGSHSEGENTTASGTSSHSEGQNTIAGGDYSHSEGSGTTAIGNYSHSEGFGNQAIGIGSHAEGFGNIAVGNYQHVQGIYNATATTQNAFIIGNGKTNIDRTNLVLAASGFFNIYGNLNVLMETLYLQVHRNILVQPLLQLQQ